MQLLYAERVPFVPQVCYMLAWRYLINAHFLPPVRLFRNGGKGSIRFIGMTHSSCYHYSDVGFITHFDWLLDFVLWRMYTGRVLACPYRTRTSCIFPNSFCTASLARGELCPQIAPAGACAMI